VFLLNHVWYPITILLISIFDLPFLKLYLYNCCNPSLSNLIAEKAFSEGFATAKDLVDAETTLAKVKVGRLKIMNDYVLSLAKLLEFSGEADKFLEYSQREDREREEFKEIIIENK